VEETSWRQNADEIVRCVPDECCQESKSSPSPRRSRKTRVPRVTITPSVLNTQLDNDEYCVIPSVTINHNSVAECIDIPGVCTRIADAGGGSGTFYWRAPSLDGAYVDQDQFQNVLAHGGSGGNRTSNRSVIFYRTKTNTRTEIISRTKTE